MVHVPVEDRDALRAVSVERVLCGHGDVVEQAEAHGTRDLAVMARRACPCKRRRRFARHHRVDDRARRSRGVHRGAPRAGTRDGVRVEPAAARLGRRADVLDVRGRMDALQLLHRHGGCLSPLPAEPVALLELVLDRGNPGLVLRVGTGVVLHR